MTVLGVVTLGQAPRTDVVPELERELGPGVSVVEAGALDDADEREIAELAPRPGETGLASRLRDGRGVALSKPRLMPRLEAAVARIGARCNAILVLCSGHFPPLASPVPVYLPEPILHGAVHGLVGSDQVLGVVSPLESQAAAAAEKWADVGAARVVGVCASPYGSDEALQAALATLRAQGAATAVLDCMGFTARQREVARAAFGGTVLRAPALVARVLGEVF